jgi:hypothetical protein
MPLLLPNCAYEWSHVRSAYLVNVPEISILMLWLMPPGNTTEQSSPPEYRNLHAEFHTILKLTELVLAINNSGHPTLHLPREAYTSTPLLDVLLAITTLLVRDHEVVALGILGKNIIAVQQQTIASTPVLTNEDEDFMGELHFDEDLDCSNIRVSNIAAVINPRVGDKYDIPDGDYCIVVNTGESLLVVNMLKGKEGWRYLDKLRCNHHPAFRTAFIHALSDITGTHHLWTISALCMSTSHFTGGWIRLVVANNTKINLSSICWPNAGPRCCARSQIGPRRVTFCYLVVWMKTN